MGNRDENWHLRDNPLVEARDRGRLGVVGDVNLNLKSPGLAPMRTPMVETVVKPQVINPVRKMGTTTIDERRYGNRNLWKGTPMETTASTVDDPEIFDVGEILKDFDRVGWFWDRSNDRLEAYLTKGDRTFVVRIPWKKLRRIISNVVCRCGGQPVRDATLDGFFKNVGRSIKRSVTAPVRFVKSPKTFVKELGNDIKHTVRKVAKPVVNVASHPVFGAAMAGLAAVPPLTAVGGAGLAAYAAANAAKPVIDNIDKGIKKVDQVKKTVKSVKRSLPSKQGAKPIKRQSSNTVRVDPRKAVSQAATIKKQMDNLPPRMRRMFAAALKSEPVINPKGRTYRPKRRKTRRPRYILEKGGVLRRL